MTWSVYQINHGKRPVYIGFSKHPEQRAKQHRRTGVMTKSMNMSIIWGFADCDIGGARALESFLIRELRPTKNKLHGWSVERANRLFNHGDFPRICRMYGTTPENVVAAVNEGYAVQLTYRTLRRLAVAGKLPGELAELPAGRRPRK